MDQINPANGCTLRPATQTDASTIRHIISKVNINPMGLDWRRFILAIDPFGKVIGCGQVKPHADGSSELASIAVLPGWRGKGIARQIIENLLKQHPGRLYLTCQPSLEPLYQKFGFQVIPREEMPPYFQRLIRLVALFNIFIRQPNLLLVMRRD